jgi:hypothetical protein
MGFGACATEADEPNEASANGNAGRPICKRRDLRFPSLSREIALRLSSRDGYFGVRSGQGCEVPAVPAQVKLASSTGCCTEVGTQSPSYRPCSRLFRCNPSAPRASRWDENATSSIPRISSGSIVALRSSRIPRYDHWECDQLEVAFGKLHCPTATRVRCPIEASMLLSVQPGSPPVRNKGKREA